MGLKFPEKSKAPAYVQPAGGAHSESTTVDPCCIPESVPPLLANAGMAESTSNDGTWAGFIPPTAH